MQAKHAPNLCAADTALKTSRRLRLLHQGIAQIGPGVGLCLSEMIVDGATPTPLEPFAIGRFRSEATANEKFRKEFD